MSICQYCKREFKRPCACALHERTCSLNPDPKPYEHKIPKQVKKPCECKICHIVFPSRSEMRIHFKSEHKELTRSRDLKICKLCGQEYVNIRKHNRVCQNKEHHHKFTDDEKKSLSQKRIAYLKANPDKHPWKYNNKFKSKPCEHLKDYLRDRDISFEEEYTDPTWDRSYSMDIAIVDKKIDLEVNGNQHYDKGKLKENYQRRHDYLESLGWTILEIPYLNCFKNNELQKIFEKISK
jgi:hypothetical protein